MDTSTHLPSLPHVLLKLIQTYNQEPDAIKAMHQIINKDAALCARLMGMANSVYYGPPNKVAGIEQALLLVGTNGIKNIVTSTSVDHAFDQARVSSFVPVLKQFWFHSLTCATLAKLIAEKISYPAPEEAYLSGLLHDIGKLVLWANLPQEQERQAESLQLSKTQANLLLACERESGTTHYEAGAWLINQWRLQSFMADAVRYHHEPIDRILDALPLVKIVFVANSLCSETG
jgi:putative nucleotidyltransferase with HDIG domain